MSVEAQTPFRLARGTGASALPLIKVLWIKAIHEIRDPVAQTCLIFDTERAQFLHPSDFTL